MKKKKNNSKKFFITKLLVSVLAFFAIFSSSPTFAYWLSIMMADDTKNDQVQVGTWIYDFIITVDRNQSDDFSTFEIRATPNEPLGATKFSDNLGFTPAPKTHSGVDQSGYAFDRWYTSAGVEFKSSTVITSDMTIYPSWDSTLFEYSKKASETDYILAKQASVTFNDANSDLWIPGWRYKGLPIRGIYQNATSRMQNITAKNLYIGDGIGGNLAYQSFMGTTANSLYLGEGLTGTLTYVFQGSTISGSLRIPSTMVSIGGYALFNVGFNGTLDLSDASSLVSIGTAAFMNNNFIGGLEFPENVETIGQQAFCTSGFNGPLDLSAATKVSSIGTHAFNNTGLTGVAKIGKDVTLLSGNSFKTTKITVLDLSEAENLTEIGGTAFQGTPLETIIFPENGSLKIIGTQSFQGAKLTGYLILPSTLETINGVAFDGSSGLTKVFIPISVTYIGNGIFGGKKDIQVYYEGSSIPSAWSATWYTPNAGYPIIFNASVEDGY